MKELLKRLGTSFEPEETLREILAEAVSAERRACAAIAAEAAKLLGAAPGNYSEPDADCCQLAALAVAQDIGTAILDRGT